MNPLKTYLVEDSAVIRESLIAALEELGPIEVVGTAEDEASAVQWLTRADNQFDLVIVDIFLKGGSGLGVLRAANALAPRRNMVVLSNYATPDMRRKCLELGADRVFDKSSEVEELLAYCARVDGGGTTGTDSRANIASSAPRGARCRSRARLCICFWATWRCSTPSPG